MEILELWENFSQIFKENKLMKMRNQAIINFRKSKKKEKEKVGSKSNA